MKTIIVIPARGNSKGIKKKNLINFCGKPLLHWTIIQAKKSKTIGTVIVTTDSSKIAKIARNYGAIVPFIRPKSLAGSLSSTEDTLKHALITYEKQTNYKFDIAVYLSACDFFRKKNG